MPDRFADRLVVITGAAGGLGRALAQGFAREGASLVLTDVDQPGLRETERMLRDSGAACSSRHLDLARENEIQAFGDTLCREHPQIHVLVNNAGLAYGAITTGFETLSQEQWLHFFAVNTVAPLLLAQALRPALAKTKGVILNQSSMASFAPGTAYGVTKSSLNAMTFGMARAFGAEGIRVNAIAPGLMETPASQAFIPPEHYKHIQSQQLLQLHGSAEDIVSLALFLASEDARFITCEIVSCDAGHRMRGWRS